MLDGFSAERLLLATSPIERSSNQREPSGGLNGPWCHPGEESQKGWRKPQTAPVFGLGLVSASTFIQGHKGRDCGPVLSQTTVLGQSSPLQAAQHCAECGGEGASWTSGALLAKQSWMQPTRPSRDLPVELKKKRSVCISSMWVT